MTEALAIVGAGKLGTAIARAAHRLKGASGMIGALALRQIAEAVERAAKAEDLSTVRRLRHLFDHEVHRLAEQAGLAEGSETQGPP